MSGRRAEHTLANVRRQARRTADARASRQVLLALTLGDEDQRRATGFILTMLKGRVGFRQPRRGGGPRKLAMSSREKRKASGCGSFGEDLGCTAAV